MKMQFPFGKTEVPHLPASRRLVLRNGITGVFLAAAAPGWAFDPGAKKSSVAETAVESLKPGQFIWEPQLAPAGPMTVVVNLPAQLAYVYRNGVRIGATTVSSGKPGHETPTGVFTILQKDKDHHSKKYNNAPMPFTQRLTWDGIALHAGGLPGYPSSHGCVHLPLAFSEGLFKETSMGMTVIITGEKPSPQTVIDPGLVTTAPAGSPAARLNDGEQFRWNPDLSPSGPVMILISFRDQRVLVLRNGRIIGRSRVEIPPGVITGTHALQMLGIDPSGDPRWFYVGLPGHESGRGKPLDPNKTKQVHIPPQFRADVLAILKTGVTMLATEDTITGGDEGSALTVMASV
jgi:hypothetical protein